MIRRVVVTKDGRVLSGSSDSRPSVLGELSRCAASIEMSELLVGSALPDFRKTQGFETCHDLTRLQDRKSGHGHETSSVCVPTNCDSSSGSPPSSNIEITSRRFWCNSSRVLP